MDYTTKRCSTCKEYFPATPEYWNRQTDKADGLRSQCKNCHRAASHRYYHSHSQLASAATKQRRANNHSAFRERERKWKHDHKDLNRANSARRRARAAMLPDDLTNAEWHDTLAYFGDACAYCGRAQQELHGALNQEHVIPVSQGGGYTKFNIVPACGSCNSSKSAKTPGQAGMALIKPWPPARP